jgi:8-oxo-dGTP pyrophosphatase MutT (NUDIX family)
MRNLLMITTDFISKLKTELSKELPGTAVQWEMSSLHRLANKFPYLPGEDARVAAVLILLYPVIGSIHTVFMQRPDYDGVHGGQISFPGGKKEPGDEGVIQTALREAHEETGINSSDVTILGSLTPLFIPVSNMLVTPVVGYLPEKPWFKHKPDEVLFLIDAELKRFLDPSIIKSKPYEVRGEMIEIKYFDYEGNTIWGATAMILQEFLTIIRRAGIFLQE